MWSYTLKEAEPYFKYMRREELFRDAVIGFLVDESKLQENVNKEYCRACKLAHPDIDCSKCTKDIQYQEGKEKKNWRTQGTMLK